VSLLGDKEVFQQYPRITQESRSFGFKGPIWVVAGWLAEMVQNTTSPPHSPQQWGGELIQGS
jgi:hypothetical protein